jgi:hypothetical protein
MPLRRSPALFLVSLHCRTIQMTPSWRARVRQILLASLACAYRGYVATSNVPESVFAYHTNRVPETEFAGGTGP